MRGPGGRRWRALAIGCAIAAVCVGVAIPSWASGRLGSVPSFGVSGQRGVSVARFGGSGLLAPGSELVELRTRDSRTFVGPNGTFRTVISASSANYRDAQGAWQPIDDSLVASTDAGFAVRNRANHYVLDLPSDLGSPVQVSDAGRWVAFSLAGASGAGAVSGSTDTYAGALPGVDVSYTASADTVKEALVLHSASAAASYSFDVRASAGLSASLAKSGAVEFRDRAGALALAFAPPVAVDHAGQASRATFALAQVAGGWHVTVLVPAAWLADPARAFPVVVDPTVTFTGASQDCYMWSGSGANSPYCFNPTLDPIGYHSHSSQNARTLMLWNVSSIPSDATVLSGDLAMYMDGGNSQTVDAYQLTQSWTNAMTWNSYDGTHSWATPGGDFGSTPAGTAMPTTSGQWYHWYLTGLVQNWTDGAAANDGLILKSRSEDLSGSDTVNLRSSWYSGYAPTLTVTYESARLGPQPQFSLDKQQLTDKADLQVNVANGNLILHNNDLHITGTAGMDLSLDRWFNGQSVWNLDNGHGWTITDGADIWMSNETAPNAAAIAFYGPGFSVGTFTRNADGSYNAPTGVDATLVQNQDASLTLTFNHTALKYNFSSGGQLTSQSDRNGNTISYTYNGDGTVNKITDTQGRQVTFTYNTNGRITKITDSTGRNVQYAYTSNHLTSYTDAAGKTTSYAYDGNDDITQITDPAGDITKLTYNSNNQVTSVTRVTNIGAGTGPTTSYSYGTATGCPTSHNTVVTDPNSNKTTYCFDPADRATQTTDPLGHQTSDSYTSDSSPTELTLPTGAQTTLTYSTLAGTDRLSSVTEATGASTSESYGDSTHPYYPTTSTDGQGNATTASYDAAGNIRTITDANGKQTTYTYNANGTLASVKDPNGNTTSYGYDSTGNQTSMTPPSPRHAESQTVDALSRVATRTDGNANTSTDSYDALDRITKVAYQDGTSVAYTYDADGNMLTQVDSTGTTTDTYDALNRLTQESLPASTTNTYSYDPNGNLTSLADAGGTVSYAYNADNLLTSVTDPGAAKTTFAYDANNDRTTTTYPNGVTMTDTYSTDSSGHATGRLARVTGKNSGGTTLTDYNYSYSNGSGHDTDLRQSVTDTGSNTTAYTYDPLNRLTEGKTTLNGGGPGNDYKYAYDAAGNRTSQTINSTTTSYTSNAADELTTAGPTTYSYDNAGNQTAISGGDSFTYNAANQTSSITPNGGSAISMAYTGDGQTKRVTAGSSTYVNSSLGLTAATDSTGSTYYTRDNTGTLVDERTPSGAYYYLLDALGSVVGLTSSSGSLTVTYTYDPFGNVTGTTGSVANPWRYTGAYYDATTGLYKIGERYYDPNTGTWTQPDPLNHSKDPTQYDPYTYVSDNPVNSVDPTGLAPSCPLPTWGYTRCAEAYWRCRGGAPSGSRHERCCRNCFYGCQGAGEACYPGVSCGGRWPDPFRGRGAW